MAIDRSGSARRLGRGRRSAPEVAPLAGPMLCFLVGCWLSAGSIAAEPSVPANGPGQATAVTVIDGRVNGAFEQVPIAEAIETIGGQAGFAHSVRPWVAEETVSMVFDELPVDQALAKLLADFNYILEAGPDGAVAALWVTGLKAEAPVETWVPEIDPSDKLQDRNPLLARRSTDEPADVSPTPLVSPISVISGPWDRKPYGPLEEENLDMPADRLPTFKARVDERGPAGPEADHGVSGMLAVDAHAFEVELSAEGPPAQPLPPFEPVYSDAGPSDFYAAPQILPEYNEVEERWEFPDE